MAKNIDSLGIIPARFGSTRFPGKPLADIGGQSMIRRVVGQVVRSSLSEVIVATDDDRIFRHVEASNNRVTMTSPFHKSGTGRCAEVAAREEFRSVKWVVNIQGDEPFIQPSQIDHLLSFLKNNSQFDIATPAFPLSDRDQLSDPHIVKTVFDKNNRALYFSRSPIPFLKKTTEENKPPNVTFYKHIGIYAFKKEVLLKIAALPPSPLEQAESLEQLRWLEHGFSIGIQITDTDTIGIDTEEDLKKWRKLAAKGITQHPL